MDSGFKITKYLGISFLLVGILRLFNLVPTGSIFLLCISLSAFFLIITDLISLWTEDIPKTKDKHKIWKLLHLVNNSLYFAAIFSSIGLPFIYQGFNLNVYPPLTDALSIFGIGLAIYIIGVRSEKMVRIVLKGELRSMFDEIAKTKNNELNSPENLKLLNELVKKEFQKLKEKDQK